MHLELSESTRLAFDSLRQHKTRSLLTVLGVVIGIMAIVAVASIMVGLDRDIRGFLDQYGTDTLFVFRFDFGFRGTLTSEERNRKPLTYEDTMAILDECPDVKVCDRGGFPARSNPANPSPLCPPVTKRTRSTDFNLPAPSRRTNGFTTPTPRKVDFFTEAENLHHMDVAVIGHDLAEGLFHDEDPMGKSVEVGGAYYRVVGVLEKRKGQFFKDESADKVVVVPYAAYRKHNPQDDENFIGAQAYPRQKGPSRRRNHRTDAPPPRCGSTSRTISRSPVRKEMARQFRQITGAIAIAVVVISSIGLLIGGVGVMNIMLMSVTERTREIGVRKAIGARRRDIIRQFLTEAMTLTGAGGIIGVALGGAISFLINKLLPSLPSAVPAMVGHRRSYRFDERRLLLRHLSRHESLAPGSRRSATLRVSRPGQ